MSRRPRFRLAIPVALALGLAVPVVASAQGVPQPHAPVSTTTGDLNAMRTAYVTAFNAKDAAGVSKHYASDAVVIDPDGHESVGAAAIAKANEDGAANWPHAVINSHSVKVYGATAIDVGTWTVHPKEGGEIVNTYLAVLRHGVNGWKLQSLAVVPVTAKQ